MLEYVLTKIQYLVSWLFPIHTNQGSTCGALDKLNVLNSVIHMSKIDEQINDIISTRVGNKSTEVSITSPLDAKVRVDISNMEIVNISVPPKSLDPIVTIKVADTQKTIKLPYSLFKELFDLVDRKIC